MLRTMLFARRTRLALFLSLMPLAAWGQIRNDAITGDTAWLLTATALVLFMTLPGLAAFYSGLVRTKNVLSVLMQCFAISCVVSVLWLIGGYGLAFGDGGGLQPWIGSVSKAWFSGVGRESLTGSIPEPAFLMFQLTFAIITPALVIGGFAERMRFSAVLWFTIAWLRAGVPARVPLGVGRRLAREARRSGFRGRHRRARECGRRRAGRGAGTERASRLSAGGHGSA